MPVFYYFDLCHCRRNTFSSFFFIVFKGDKKKERIPKRESLRFFLEIFLWTHVCSHIAHDQIMYVSLYYILHSPFLSILWEVIGSFIRDKKVHLLLCFMLYECNDVCDVHIIHVLSVRVHIQSPPQRQLQHISYPLKTNFSWLVSTLLRLIFDYVNSLLSTNIFCFVRLWWKSTKWFFDFCLTP